MTKKQVPLIIIIAVIIGGAVFGVYYLFQEKQSMPSKQEEFAKFKSENPETENSALQNTEFTTSCDDFPEISGEISCKEAKEIALEKDPGEIYDINKVESGIDKFWVIKIQQEEKKTEVLIDMEGNIIRTK